MYVLTVVLKPAPCSELAPYLRPALLAAQRTDGVTFSADTWEVVADVETLAAAHARRPVVAQVVAEVVSPRPSATMAAMELTVSEFAKQANRSRQGVLKMINTDRLPARRDHRGRYLIPASELETA